MKPEEGVYRVNCTYCGKDASNYPSKYFKNRDGQRRQTRVMRCDNCKACYDGWSKL